MSSSTSQPLLTPTPAEVPAQANYLLLGWPLYLTNSILNNEAVGSGSNQSHLTLCSGKNIHVGESGALAVEVSNEFAFDANEIALRIAHRIALNYQPPAAFCVLAGIN